LSTDKAPMETSVSEVIDAVWSEIRRILGATMAASLFRRTIAECGGQCPMLARIDVHKDGANYTYIVPSEIEDDPDARAELTYFVDTILSLLSRISGDVLVSILMRNHVISATAGKEWTEHGQS
jgi:hypothetical protein